MPSDPTEHFLHTDTSGSRRRAVSLTMTLMGDTIVPRGGGIWLGAMIRLLSVMSVGERLVRTSVYRLRQDGWLETHRRGRRSLYRLTESGARSTRQAETRIYYPQSANWTGGWHLVLAGNGELDTHQRQELRKRMRWLGFGVLAPGVFGHPTADLEPVRRLLEEMGIEDSTMIMHARSMDTDDSRAARLMAEQCCDLGALEVEYTRFIQRYQALAQDTSASFPGDDAHCFLIRLAMIHDYRRILLRDPTLPAALLPNDWAGRRAGEICAAVYRRVWPGSERFVSATAGADEELRCFSPQFRSRFGGLGENPA
jgi:phenylacetic acid degradation operon negative regulatory protein